MVDWCIKHREKGEVISLITVKSTQEKYLMDVTGATAAIRADVPEDHGGKGQHLAPFELLRAAFATCLCVTCQMLLNKRGIQYRGVEVKVDVDKDSIPGKTMFTYKVVIDADISDVEKDKFAKMAYNGCPVHKALSQEITFAEL